MLSLLVPSDVVESPDQRRNGFPFRSGSVVLDFVATVAKRDAPDPTIANRELLIDAAAFVDWARVAGFPPVTERVTPGHLRRAREMREALNRLTRDRVHERVSDADDVEILNAAARRATPALQLDPTATAAVAPRSVDAPAILALVAREAVDLFSGEYAARIRLCRGHDCSLYFVDRSRAGNRAWCSMSACGVKNSSARYRARTRTAGASRPPHSHP